MAEKPQAAPPAPKSEPEAAPKKKGTLMVGGILAGVMLVEGAGLYVGMKMFGAGPQTAGSHEGLVENTQRQPAEPLEVPVAKIKVPNRMSGRTFMYDIEIAVRIKVPDGKNPEEFRKEVAKRLEERDNAIRDRLNCLIRSTEPQHLEEAGLVVMRRQIKSELDKVLGDDKVIESVLIPKWQSMRMEM
jgi:flagellar basal body-associated protein FliL